jgi:hypothetical protein
VRADYTSTQVSADGFMSDGQLCAVNGRKCASSSVELFGLLPSLDIGGPEARRDASHPAPLRSSPHIPVRSFERLALTQSASRISGEDALQSVVTSL